MKEVMEEYSTECSDQEQEQGDKNATKKNRTRQNMQIKQKHIENENDS